jgi:hypothetical protein
MHGIIGAEMDPGSHSEKTAETESAATGRTVEA